MMLGPTNKRRRSRKCKQIKMAKYNRRMAKSHSRKIVDFR